MKPNDFFTDGSLTAADLVTFAKVFKLCLDTLGRDRCWCLKERTHSIFSGFSTAHPNRGLYKGQDVRPLVLAMSGRFYSDERPVSVRRACCSSVYCINPLHYYYGTRGDVAMETTTKKPKARAKQNQVTPEVVENLRQDKEAGESILSLSRKYKLPYHVARRICNDETYNEYNGTFTSEDEEQLWNQTIANCVEICNDNPTEARSFNLAFHVTEQLQCPWHRNGATTHKGNFGLMGECLDCMKEIKAGRCLIDVTQFDMAWYWSVKRFWEKVDIQDEDSCWPWDGKLRRGKSESVAYFPSPFHNAKTQSAPRVAFWLARGYTGKYRVFSRPECDSFCCNPKHLTIREFKDLLPPSKISTIRLSHGNIFESFRENQLQMQSNSAE